MAIWMGRMWSTAFFLKGIDGSVKDLVPTHQGNFGYVVFGADVVNGVAT